MDWRGALMGLVAAAIATGCHDHPVPDDVVAPMVACGDRDGGYGQTIQCQSTGYCVGNDYYATVPAGTCGADGYCHWGDPTSLRECQCGCNVEANRCGNCGPTAY